MRMVNGKPVYETGDVVFLKSDADGNTPLVVADTDDQHRRCHVLYQDGSGDIVAVADLPMDVLAEGEMVED